MNRSAIHRLLHKNAMVNSSQVIPMNSGDNNNITRGVIFFLGKS
jgi:hypothetical protein